MGTASIWSDTMPTGNGRKLLIVEDEISVAKQLRWGLDKQYEIKIAANGDEARSLLSKAIFPVVTLDLGLPPQPDTAEEGFRLLKDIRTLAPKSKVIVITGSTLEENAVKAIALGAVDFCSKPIDLKILEIILSRWFRIHDLEEANRALEQQAGKVCSLCDMLGTSPAMTRLFELIRSVSATDYPVLPGGVPLLVIPKQRAGFEKTLSETPGGKRMAGEYRRFGTWRAKARAVFPALGLVPRFD